MPAPQLPLFPLPTDARHAFGAPRAALLIRCVAASHPARCLLARRADVSAFPAAVVVGAIGAYAVLFGGLWFATFISAIVFQSTGEYFLMVTAQGEAEAREVAPPAWAQKVARAFCTLIPYLTYFASNRMKATLTGAITP